MFEDLEKSARGFHDFCVESNFDALFRLSKKPALCIVNALRDSWGFCTDLGDAFHSKRIQPVQIVRSTEQIDASPLVNKEEDEHFHGTLE